MFSKLVSICLLIAFTSSLYNPEKCPVCAGADDTSCPEGCSCMDASEINIELDGWFCGGDCCGTISC